MLPCASHLQCFNSFVKQIKKDNDRLFDAVQAELKKTIHIPKIKEDSEAIIVEFSSMHAEFILTIIHSIAIKYEKLFCSNRDNCAAHLTPQIASLVAMQKKSLGSSAAAAAALSSFSEMLADFVVSESNKIAENLPEKSIFEIYMDVVYVALQHILPAVSSAGVAWGFANAFKSDDEKTPFNKKLKDFFQNPEKAAHILSQRGSLDEKKYIKNQTHAIRDAICTVIREYFNVFQKRETFGTVASPL
jgi:hypothetical protein